MVAFNHGFILRQREKFGWTRLDLVKQLFMEGLDIVEETMRRWEEGDNSPPADALPVLCKVLKCRMQELFDEK